MTQSRAEIIHDALAASAASKATQVGGWGGALLAWMGSSEAAVLFGILIGVMGLVVNIYFSNRRDAREQREFEARMHRMEPEP